MNKKEDIKIVDCEICLEKFPIDCFEFFPCTHKVCLFCYNKLRDLQCPYCRINMNIQVSIKNNSNVLNEEDNEYEDNEYEEDNESNYENNNFDLPELPITRRQRNNRNNRNNISNRSNASNVSNVSTKRQSNNSSERFST